MGIFDNNGDRIKYLEKENREAWKRIVQLENNYNNLKQSLTKSTSESHSEASQNSKKQPNFVIKPLKDLLKRNLHLQILIKIL
jgi:molecular chaperone GrpE (heat shock protein)